MFDIQDTKAFKDSVHGYINIPRIFVKELIDTDYFQRLRNIDQTGMRILYPDAKHDRYGHSLGVFYLGCKAVDAMLSNFSQSRYWQVSSIKTENYKFWAKNKILFLIACLLHDIGHTPFSHSLEDLFQSKSCETNITIFEKFIKTMAQDVEPEEWKNRHNIEKSPAVHEMMGALLVLENGEHSLREHIKNIFDYLIDQCFPRPQQDDILYAEHHHYDATVEQITNDDLLFIARMITGVKYVGGDYKNQIRNCFIELLNGSIFDVDQLDYIMRDTQMSGINNISIDVERLLSSINIVHSVLYENCRVEDARGEPLNCENKTITELEFNGKDGDTSDAQMIIRGEIKGRFCIPVGYKVSIINDKCEAKKSSFERLSGKKDYSEASYITIVNGKKEVIFNKNTMLYCSGSRITGENDVRLNQQQGNYYIENAVVEDDAGFVFQLVTGNSGEQQNEAYLDICGYCNIKIERCGHSPKSLKIDGNMRLQSAKISGRFSKLIILDEDLRESSRKDKYTILSIGYHKQAMNIIANVIEARNYLYMWIYAHHKVVYYANFLLPCVADKLTTVVPKPLNGLSKIELTYENLQYLDDAYLWTLVRQNGLSISADGEHNDIRALCDELVGRSYMSSLFKSFAEFDLLFALYDDTQLNDLGNKLFDRIDAKKPNLSHNDICLAGYLAQQNVDEINNYIATRIQDVKKRNEIETIVIVRAQYKEKYLNQNATYIVMRDEVVTMDQIPSLSKKRIGPGDRDRYFYVYYKTKKSSEPFTHRDKTQYKEAVKMAFKTFFDKIV